MLNPDRPVVMLLGTFHFANPQRDLVKSDVVDVMSQASQTYLDQLSHSLLGFQPTRVLLEYAPTEDENVNSRYRRYREGHNELSYDEIEQLGFRIAKKANIDCLHSFDEREIPWLSHNLFKKLKGDPATESRFNEAIHQLTIEEKKAHATLSLRDLLKRYNSPELDTLNKSLYLMTNKVGVDDGFAGADAAASWWHRNFRMFARVQKFARNQERLLVIGGQGHIAVLRDLLKLDPDLDAAEIGPYL